MNVLTHVCNHNVQCMCARCSELKLNVMPHTCQSFLQSLHELASQPFASKTLRRKGDRESSLSYHSMYMYMQNLPLKLKHFFNACIYYSTYHNSAVFIGVVRQAVKRSAGSFGFIGNISLEPQAASSMDSSNNPRQLEFDVERLIDP